MFNYAFFRRQYCNIRYVINKNRHLKKIDKKEQKTKLFEFFENEVKFFQVMKASAINSSQSPGSLTPAKEAIETGHQSKCVIRLQNETQKNFFNHFF